MIRSLTRSRVARNALAAEFRDKLPRTKIDKIAYTELEKEEVEKLLAAGNIQEANDETP